MWVLLAAACMAMPHVTRAVPFTSGIERTLHDVYRYLLAPQVEQPGGDPDIALVVYTDSVARSAQKYNPVDRAMLARVLTAIEQAGARAVAIDMIFTVPTADEQALIDTLSTMKIPVFLAYGDPAHDRIAYWDIEVDADARAYQDHFHRRIENGPITAVSPAVGSDESGVMRRWPELGTELEPELGPTAGKTPPLAYAMAGLDGPYYRGAIQFQRLSRHTQEAEQSEANAVFPTYSFDLLLDPDLSAIFLPELEGRFVLIGADTFNDDQHTTPISRIAGDPRVAGVSIHAQMLRQALGGAFPPPLPAWALLAMTLLVSLAGAASALVERRGAVLGLLALIQFACLASAPLALSVVGYDYLDLPLFGLALAWLLAFLVVSYVQRSQTSVERAFARDALGKFLPESVARQILDRPELLALAGEERELCMMFTDLEGFTRFSHGRAAPATAAILNRYLEEMSAIILDHGGTLDKFVGDALVAFWGAPIAAPDDAERCVACAIALQAASEQLRDAIAAEYGDTLGRTRIGLNAGTVVVGNFGGQRRIQYTALGDAMNVAARLEAANKYLGTQILASAAIRARAPGFVWRPLGAVVLSGVDTPIDLFEPVAAKQADYAQQWTAAMDRLSHGDTAAAGELQALARQHPGDRALVQLAARADTITGGKAYVLESK